MSPVKPVTYLEIPAGRDVIRVCRSDYAGVTRLDLRRYYVPAIGEEPRPTQKGVAINIADLVKLRVAIEAAERDALQAGLLDEESYESAGAELPARLLD